MKGVFKDRVDGDKDMPFVPAARLISEVRADFLKEGRGFRNFSARFEMDNTFAQNNPFTGFNTETATKGYTLFNAGVGVDLMTGKGKLLASIYLTALNIGDVAYQNHLSRLKYAAENVVTGRVGVFDMGRNYSLKVNIPISFIGN